MTRDEQGGILLLGIGFVLAAILGVVVAVDAGSVYLARRNLAASADAAALAGAQSVDLDEYYAYGADSVTALDRSRVKKMALKHLDASDAAGSFRNFVIESITTDGYSVNVRLRATVKPPFLSVIDEYPTIQVHARAELAYRE